jgi:hypothetical protein
LELWSDGRKTVEKSHLSQDKGHRAECEAFVRAIKEGRPSPIPLDSIVNTTLATIRIAESVHHRQPQEILWTASVTDRAPEISVTAKDTL